MASMIKTKVIQPIRNTFSILRWAFVYKWKVDLFDDVIASICDAAVAAPEAIGYAGIAGLPGTAGLYSVFIGPIAYALVGSSPQLVTGPTNVMSALVLTSMPKVWAGAPLGALTPAYAAVATLLAFATGIIQIMLSWLRLGFFSALISEPVFTGFVSGAAFLSVAGQLTTMLGLPKCGKANAAGLNGYGSNMVANGATIKYAPLASFICVAFLVLWRRLLPRVLPGRWSILANAGPLALMIVSGGIAYAYPATIGNAGISLVGKLVTGLPQITFPSYVNPSASDISNLVAAAFPCAFVGYIESLSIASTVSRRFGPYEIESNTEMLAAGVANVAVGLTSGYPVTGSFSRTAVNAASGSRSGLSSLLSSFWILVILLTLIPALSWVPSLAISSIIAVALSRLVEVGTAVRYFQTEPLDFIVFIGTFMTVLFSTIPFGILFGVVAAALAGFCRTLRPQSPVRVYQWASQLAIPVTTLEEPAIVTQDVTALLIARGFNFTELQTPAVRVPSIMSGITSSSPNENNSAQGADGLRATTGGERRNVPETPAGATSPFNGRDTEATGTSSGDVGIRIDTVAVISFGPDLTYVSADRLRTHVSEVIAVYHASVVIVDARGVGSCDVTGARALFSEAENIARNLGGVIVAAGLDPRVLGTLVRFAHAEKLAVTAFGDAANIATASARGVGAPILGVGPLLVTDTLVQATRIAAELTASALLAKTPVTTVRHGCGARTSALTQIDVVVKESSSTVHTAPTLEVDDVGCGPDSTTPTSVDQAGVTGTDIGTPPLLGAVYSSSTLAPSRSVEEASGGYNMPASLSHQHLLQDDPTAADSSAPNAGGWRVFETPTGHEVYLLRYPSDLAGALLRTVSSQVHGSSGGGPQHHRRCALFVAVNGGREDEMQSLQTVSPVRRRPVEGIAHSSSYLAAAALRQGREPRFELPVGSTPAAGPLDAHHTGQYPTAVAVAGSSLETINQDILGGTAAIAATVAVRSADVHTSSHEQRAQNSAITSSIQGTAAHRAARLGRALVATPAAIARGLFAAWAEVYAVASDREEVLRSHRAL